MGQVSVTLNDRTYRLVCDDGEEDRLAELAGYVKSKVERLRAEVGHVGDERLMLMAALMITDELWDALADIEASTASGALETLTVTEPSAKETEPVRRLKGLAAKMANERDGAAVDPAKADPPVHAQPTVANVKPRRRDVA